MNSACDPCEMLLFLTILGVAIFVLLVVFMFELLSQLDGRKDILSNPNTEEITNAHTDTTDPR